VGLRFHEPCERPRWGVELSARIVDDQDRVASSLQEQDTPGFTTYDLRSYWQATDGLVLVAGIENFTDKNYREHLDLRTGRGVFQPGINFYFGFEWRY
jgi:outer membrane receptor protein involved in Fe transport